MNSDAFRTCRSTGTSCARCARFGVLVGGDTLPDWPRMQVLTTAPTSPTGALGVVGGDTLPDLPRGAAGRAASARVRACTCSQRRPPPPHSRRIRTGVGTSSASCAHASAHDGARLPPHRCGHVLCLVCALRYHSACDASGKACTCPLCLAPVLQGERCE